VKKVLIITYYWPPSGGSGVQRWLKFVKYLPEFGIQPIVLTVDPEFATYPARDESLLRDIAPELIIYRTKSKDLLDLYRKVSGKEAPHSGFANEKKIRWTDKVFRFIRGNFFIPDARIGWNKFALEEARKIIREHNIDTIITSSPPHSTQLIGLQLKKEFPLTWIADLRDPWSELFYNKELFRTKLAKKRDNRLEESVLNAADQLVVVSDAIRRSFAKGKKEVLNKIHVIPNGFDESDFPDSIPRKDSKIRYISYIGNLGPQYPVTGFLKAFSVFSKDHEDWKLRFIGNCHPGVKRNVEELDLKNKVEFISYVPHNEAVNYMISSDALLMIIPEIEKNKGILTGKLFEYIASSRPVINIGPTDGDAARILSEFPQSATIEKEEVELMIRFLESIENSTIQEASKERMKYSRRSLTRQIAALIPN
jgi:glycosyltransferase involved in cell wall biosynthesis